MKKLIFAIVFSLFFISSYAQSHFDALRFSQNYYTGTARFMSMGGAFSALGADLSVLATNPAGLSVYHKGEFSFTPNLFSIETKSNFYGSGAMDNKYAFGLNNIGIAGTIHDDSFGDWKGVSFGVAYNKLNNFNENIVIEGSNEKGSILDYWMYNSDGISDDKLNSFGEFLAWDNYLLDYVNDQDLIYTNPHWWNGGDPVYGQTQRKIVNRKGGMGSFDFAFSANYRNMLYFGTSLGIQSFNFEENSTLTESDDLDLLDYTSFDYQEHLKITGTGVNFKIGMIIKPIQILRIGLAFHTPTFVSLHEKYYSSLYSIWDTPDADGYSEYESISPNNEYDYELTTPLKAIASVAFVIPKIGIISAEYEHVDYSQARLRADDYDFYDENNAANRDFTRTQNIRVGGEFLFGPFSFRAGYALYGNPFSTDAMRTDALRTNYSGGVGLRGDHIYMDIAYVYTTMDDSYLLYTPMNVDERSPELERTMANIMLTFGVKF